MYPWEFMLQFGTRTTRFIDDIFTIRFASQIGSLDFEDTGLKGSKLWEEDGRACGETYGGMYDKFFMHGDELVPTTISITREQQGSNIHFLDMEIVRYGLGPTHVKMYDKRDYMPTRANYRRFPHCETKLCKRCLFSVLHSQLCRFATRCTRIYFFETAAAGLMADMSDHFYDRHT